MTKKRKNLIAVLGILSVLFITTGATYAFFSYAQEGSTENTIKSGSITFHYDEINRQGNSISIEDALPTSDTDGKASTNAFNFKISSKTASNIAIPYEITLRQKAGTDNIGDKIKIYLAKTTGYEAAVGTETEVKTSIFNSLPTTTHNGYSERTLHTDEVPQSSANYEQNYRLKMWLDSSADYSDGTLNNKTFTVMVNVYANGRMASSNANIESVAVNNTVLTAVNANEYEATLEPETTQATVRVETEDDNSTVDIIKTESDYETPVTEANNIQRLANTVNRTVNLTEGDNYFKITVTSENSQHNKVQHLKLTVPPAGITLKDKILVDNPIIKTNPTLSNTSEATNENGLYSATVLNGYGGQSAQGTTYFFRGNVENNYVSFAGKTWRIIRINEDGTVRIILNSSIYREEFNTTNNDFAYSYYSNSEGKTKVDNWYATNITGDNALKVASGNYFCEAAKVKYGESEYVTSGNASPTSCYSYVPDLACNTDGNNKGLLNGNVGLITYDEVVLAGGRFNNSNKNYYLSQLYYPWTMSPETLHSGYDTCVWYIDNDGKITHNTVTQKYYFYPVINLKTNVIIEGSGTQADPYVVQ